jgi:hypothetical protein
MTRHDSATPLTPAGRDLGELRCCNGCHEWKHRTEDNYFRDRDGPLGWSRKCKICDRAYQALRRERVKAGVIHPKRRVSTIG